MILRRTQIQRDGAGRCGLLTNRTFSSKRAEFPAFGVRAHTGTILHNVWFLVAPSDREAPHLPVCTNRKPFHVTRARCRVVCRPRA